MKKQLNQAIFDATKRLGWEVSESQILIDTPPEEVVGEYTTNLAFLLAKTLKKSPLTIAQELAEAISDACIDRAEAVAPGYVNISLAKETLQNVVRDILRAGDVYGKNTLHKDKKILFEYTDPNPFKVFHIGHLMPNVIGEALSRIYAFSGAEVKRAVYQGDVGMHVAKALWGAQKNIDAFPEPIAPLREFTAFFGNSYVVGSNAYETDEEAKEEMRALNKKIYERADETLNRLYDLGRTKSLEHFEEIYARLGTKFDFYFFESVTGPLGKKIVEENIQNGIFEKSQGAVVFRGEQYGLHTRVFRNKEGLPTYEAKELGLAYEKLNAYSYDQTITITGNEIQDYFKVILCVLEKISPELSGRVSCIAHGMLRFADGKMSSRKGNVITGESLMDEMREGAREKFTSEMTEEEKEKISDQIGIGAIKYSILKQSIGRDVIFDKEQSLSLEGNSGAYLQYTLVRAKSVIRKAKEIGVTGTLESGADLTGLERLLARFGDTVEYACAHDSPHFVAEYLFILSQSFNAFYAKNTIASLEDRESPYRVAVTQSVAQVLETGITLLGIPTPKRM